MDLRVVVVVALLAACRPPLPPQFAGGARASVEIETGHVLVIANADGKRMRFVVDTGASITSLTPTAAKQLGVAPTGVTMVRGQVVGTGTLRELVLAGEPHRNIRVALVEMPEARQVHRRLDGIIGLDVIAQHDIVIDYARKQLVLYAPGVLALSPTTSTMARCELSHGPHGLIMLDVGFDGGNRIPAVLDTGSPVSHFNRPAARLIGVTANPAHFMYAPDFDVGTVRVRTGFAFMKDLNLFARIGHASTPAMLLGSDAFADRALAIGYRDRIAFVSR